MFKRRIAPRRVIPDVPPTEDPQRRIFDEAVKERMEIVSGARGVKIVKLDETTATTAECAAKINEILRLLQ